MTSRTRLQKKIRHSPIRQIKRAGSAASWRRAVMIRQMRRDGILPKLGE